MTTLSEYFETESRDSLAQLERILDGTSEPDAGELHRAARGLRGTAQMAREDRVHRAASAFESALRALTANTISWSADVTQRARETVADLRALVERADADAALEARLTGTVQRWASLGIALPAHVTGGESPAAEPGSSGEFREFAAREVAGIADALDRGVQQLAAAPMDREALKMILRRQRALLGSARLGELPVVAEILRAVEDLTRVIAKLDVGVKQDWLDIYRVAREGLKATIEPLQRDQDPPASHALSRLRHMHEELLERYGAGEAVSAAHESGGLVQATHVQEPPAPAELRGAGPAEGATDAAGDGDDGPDLVAAAAGALQRAASAAQPVAAAAADAVGRVAGAVAAAAGTAADAATGRAAAVTGSRDDRTAAGAGASADVVPIEDLCYSGTAALDRALELRGIIERSVQQDAAAREAAEELFDLVRIARA
jgi:chemotaxis protein histidine kinase CheA